jgi:hypothetical protein
VPGVDLGDAGMRALDMNSCSAGGITWSAVPISDQDGMVSQAGTPEGGGGLTSDRPGCVPGGAATPWRWSPTVFLQGMQSRQGQL